MKVRIVRANLVASWSWALPHPDSDDVCGICRVQFDGTCPTCRFPGDDCTLLVGKCGHAFHMHCLLTWITQESSKGLCPMCRQKFEWRRDENRNLDVKAQGGDGRALEGLEAETTGGS